MHTSEPLAFSAKSHQYIDTINQNVRERLKEYVFDEEGKIIVSNNEYGLLRFPELTHMVHYIVNEFMLKRYSFSPQKLVEESDLLVFGTVDEHSDDHGNRTLIILHASCGFELNAEDEDGDAYLEPLTPLTFINFNENFPHSITRYDFINPMEDDEKDGFCIAISIPMLKYFNI